MNVDSRQATSASQFLYHCHLICFTLSSFYTTRISPFGQRSHHLKYFHLLVNRSNLHSCYPNCGPRIRSIVFPGNVLEMQILRLTHTYWLRNLGVGAGAGGLFWEALWVSLVPASIWNHLLVSFVLQCVCWKERDIWLTYASVWTLGEKRLLKKTIETLQRVLKIAQGSKGLLLGWPAVLKLYITVTRGKP